MLVSEVFAACALPTMKSCNLDLFRSVADNAMNKCKRTADAQVAATSACVLTCLARITGTCAYNQGHLHNNDWVFCLIDLQCHSTMLEHAILEPVLSAHTVHIAPTSKRDTMHSITLQVACVCLVVTHVHCT